MNYFEDGITLAAAEAQVKEARSALVGQCVAYAMLKVLADDMELSDKAAEALTKVEEVHTQNHRVLDEMEEELEMLKDGSEVLAEQNAAYRDATAFSLN